MILIEDSDFRENQTVCKETVDRHSKGRSKNSADQTSFVSEAIEAHTVFIANLPNFFIPPNHNPPHPSISINSFWET